MTRQPAAAAASNASRASIDTSAARRRDSGWWGQVVLLAHVVIVHDQVVVCLLVVRRRAQYHLYVAVAIKHSGVFEPLQHERFLRRNDEDDARAGGRTPTPRSGRNQRAVGRIAADLLD